MTANVVYEVFKALSEQEKGHFMALVQNDEFNSSKPPKKRKRTKKVLLTEQDAMKYLLTSVFTKSKKNNS